MRRLGFSVCGLALMAGACSLSGDTDVAREDVQALYDRYGPRGTRVERCRPATQSEVDSRTKRTVVCEIRAPLCLRAFAFEVPRAVDGEARPTAFPVHEAIVVGLPCTPDSAHRMFQYDSMKPS